MNPIIKYYKNGQIDTKAWLTRAGRYHRLDGPAVQGWYYSGRLMREVWCINGTYHRLDGPAYRWWLSNGQLYQEEWYINGVKYETEAEFLVAVDLYKANEIAELF